MRQVLIVGITDGVMPAAVREDWMAKASAAGDSASLVIVPGVTSS